MSGECCASGGNVMLLACSGGSNVGQLSNQIAVKLTQEGFGRKKPVYKIRTLFSPVPIRRLRKESES